MQIYDVAYLKAKQRTGFGFAFYLIRNSQR